ncbi:hypothetical protein [Streptomyces sp. NPDC056987]|uniref:hypothetical protein n=1 Tax=Streptomyces sp. NPDC056987 TaxID=3345988 RepID=UPI00362DF622
MNDSTLQESDYTAAETAEFRTVMSDCTTALSGALRACAPDGQWQPTSTSLVGQLTEADELLDQMYRRLGETRRAIRQIDSRARQRFLVRSVPSQSEPDDPTG